MGARELQHWRVCYNEGHRRPPSLFQSTPWLLLPGQNLYRMIPSVLACFLFPSPKSCTLFNLSPPGLTPENKYDWLYRVDLFPLSAYQNKETEIINFFLLSFVGLCPFQALFSMCPSKTSQEFPSVFLING